MDERILVVAAHPDDEVLGCGGLMAKYSSSSEVYTLILGEGMTSRGQTRSRDDFSDELDLLNTDAHKANEILGVKELYLHDFPDNRFDSVDLLDIVKVVEKYKNQIRPTKVFTHNNADLNIDHRKVFEAVLTAFRPLPGADPCEIFSFEIPSSTEWAYPYSFSPTVFVDIENTLDSKIKAMDSYLSEKKEYPHPRSSKALEYYAGMRGTQAGLKYAEAFELVRRIER